MPSRSANTLCGFVTDLHGHRDRYQKLFDWIAAARPGYVLIGGDILPREKIGSNPKTPATIPFVDQYLIPELQRLRRQLGALYPVIFIILGNDDIKLAESTLEQGASDGYWIYLHARSHQASGYIFRGYSYIPPTPFRLKDWERYDVSHYVDPGCIPPEEGFFSVPVDEHEKRYATISADLTRLAAEPELSRTIMLFHAPPYNTPLDRAALDGRVIDHVPLDVHIGSIAIRNFIESAQPLLTLHGHVHESARLTGQWGMRLGRTFAFSAAHDGPELALVRFELENLAGAERLVI